MVRLPLVAGNLGLFFDPRGLPFFLGTFVTRASLGLFLEPGGLPLLVVLLGEGEWAVNALFVGE